MAPLLAINLLNTLGIGLVLLLAAAALYLALRKSDDPARLAFKWCVTLGVVAGTLWFMVRKIGFGGGAGFVGDAFTALILAVTMAACGLVLGILWAPNIANLVGRPLASLFDGGNQQVVPQPCYSTAEARRKFGKYHEAIAEIRKQLERFPNDFQGLMLLAEVQTEDLHDLPAGEATLQSLVANPDSPPEDKVIALNRIADWRLHHGRDLEGARQALEQILSIFPEGPPAHLAAQRIAHLPTPEYLSEQHEPRAVPVGDYPQNIGLQTSPSPGPDADPGLAAVEHLRHLERFPADDEAREKLASIYAEHYRRPDLAREQLGQLIEKSDAPFRQWVRWLNLLADLEIKHAHDVTAARAALERIIERSPRSAAAENARNRIFRLGLELRGQQKSQVLSPGFSRDRPQ